MSQNQLPNIEALKTALEIFRKRKDVTIDSLAELIETWVSEFTGYGFTLCEFNESQMMILSDGFMILRYDFKHEKEIRGRLQMVGMDSITIAAIRALFLGLTK